MNFFTKNKMLFSATLAILFSLFLSNVSFAQPANDDCINAIEITLQDADSPCLWVEGTTVGATQSAVPTSVCSGSWFQDDVWFYFTTPASLKDSLDLEIKLDFGANPTDIISAGMALYSGCGAIEEPIACFSSANPDEKELLALKCLLSETTTYYIRVWSGGSPSDNSGTFSICATSTLNAIEFGNEVVVWEEQFDGGMGDWVAENCNFDTTTWEWVSPAVDYWTGRLLLSPSSCNGAMIFDAALYNDNAGVSGQPYPDHHCELVSPTIDCSTFGTVKLQFYQYNLALNGNTGDGKTFFAYSLDNGASWSDDIAVESENELTGTTNNIVGTEVRRYFLPQFAGQPECKLKFSFDADYYHWLLDDIQLIEPECTNLKIMENFVATAPYAQVPSHSVTNFPLIADIYNNGACTQTGTMLNAQLTDDADGSILYEATKDYGSIASDSLAENQLFDDLLTMPTAEGSYTLTYNLFSDSIDFDPSDNVVAAPIVVTSNTFSMDNGTTNTYQPAGLAAVPAWMDGNIYHVGDIEDGLEASVQFGMSSSEGLIGQFITVLLYEWTNSETDPDAVVQIDERTNVGFNVYEITGNEPEDGIITLPFYNPLTGTPSILEDNISYVVLVQWAPPAEGLNLFLQYDERIDFSAAAWATEQLGLHNYPTIGVVSPDSGNFDEDEDWNCSGASYGNSTAVPVIRLLAGIVDNDNVLAEENLIKLYPNPVVNQLTIQMNFIESVENVSYDIYDINGKLIQSDRLINVQQSNEQIDTRNFAPGTYHLRVISDLGVRAIPFVVQK